MKYEWEKSYIIKYGKAITKSITPQIRKIIILHYLPEKKKTLKMVSINKMLS